MSKTERALDELDTESVDDALDDDARKNVVGSDDLSDELVIVENGHDPSGDLVDLLVDTPPHVDDVDDADEIEREAVDVETEVVDVVDTEDVAEIGDVEAREGVDEPVSDDILEELRTADIDGPTVEVAPQDDTTASRRRPKRALDFDPAPMPIPTSPPRILGRKPRVRRVTRVVRHVDPWSVFKIAAVANLVLYVILLTAGVLLWNVANATGTVDNVERFFESFGWDSFEFNGGEIYHSAWIGGLFLVIGLTGLAVLAATLFNLITDLVGGMRFTVLEEEVVETRTSPMRRFVVRRPEPVVPAVVHDDESGPLIREAVVDDESKGLPF
ncbi:MAG: DUF3566 domain-containing protein [Actinomycetota bacterium]